LNVSFVPAAVQEYFDEPCFGGVLDPAEEAEAVLQIQVSHAPGSISEPLPGRPSKSIGYLVSTQRPIWGGRKARGLRSPVQGA